MSESVSAAVGLENAFLSFALSRQQLIVSNLTATLFFSPHAHFTNICFRFVNLLDFFPGYLFTALSMFTWVCWIVPENGKSCVCCGKKLSRLISFFAE